MTMATVMQLVTMVAEEQEDVRIVPLITAICVLTSIAAYVAIMHREAVANV